MHHLVEFHRGIRIGRDDHRRAALSGGNGEERLEQGVVHTVGGGAADLKLHGERSVRTARPGNGELRRNRAVLRGLRRRCQDRDSRRQTDPAGEQIPVVEEVSEICLRECRAGQSDG